MKNRVEKPFSPKELIHSVHRVFSSVKQFKTPSKTSISRVDHLMAGLAIFSLKFPSLLQYDVQRYNSPIRANLKTLYHVDTPPSDTYLRETLDKIHPDLLRPAFTKHQIIGTQLQLDTS